MDPAGSRASPNSAPITQGYMGYSADELERIKRMNEEAKQHTSGKKKKNKGHGEKTDCIDLECLACLGSCFGG